MQVVEYKVAVIAKLTYKVVVAKGPGENADLRDQINEALQDLSGTVTEKGVRQQTSAKALDIITLSRKEASATDVVRGLALEL